MSVRCASAAFVGAYSSTTRQLYLPGCNHVAEQFEPFGTFEDTGYHHRLNLDSPKSSWNLRQMVGRRELPYISSGENTIAWLFDIRDLDRWIEAHKLGGK